MVVPPTKMVSAMLFGKGFTSPPLGLPDPARRPAQHPSLIGQRAGASFLGRQRSQVWFLMPFLSTFRLLSSAATRLSRDADTLGTGTMNFHSDQNQIKYFPRRNSQQHSKEFYFCIKLLRSYNVILPNSSWNLSG